MSKTPVWVWVLLVLLILNGLRALKGQTTTLTKVAIPSFLFTAFSVHSVWDTFPPGPLVYGVWTMATLAGIVAGLVVFGFTPPVVADRSRKVLTLQGSPRVLVLTVVIFSSRFALAYARRYNPEMLHQTVPELLLLSLIAGAAGFFIGKLLSCLRILRNS
jgi:hypothetical protein